MRGGGEAVAVWIDSPGHKRNMLIEGLTHAGIGYARVSPGPGKVVYQHYWVLVMGAPLKN
ncbi:MAG: CAP domain-containing protein [Alphaproteobacteria bacterium]